MKYIFGILMLAVTFSVSAQQNLMDSLRQGNTYYQKKDFEKSIKAYKYVEDQGYENTALYFNLGNAYFKSNQLAKAILYYERAERLSPNDDDIQQNLNIARQATVDRFEKLPQPLIRTAYLAIVRALTPSGWAYAGIVALLIFLAGTYFYLFTGKKRMGFTVGLVFFILGCFLLFFAYSNANYYRNNKPAIVMATDSYIKSGPGEKAQDVFILHAGTKALVTDQYQDWKKIKLPDGKIGWIQAEDIEGI